MLKGASADLPRYFKDADRVTVKMIERCAELRHVANSREAAGRLEIREASDVPP